MKPFFTFLCLLATLLLSAQNIETFVNPTGITLKDQTDTERINLDGETKRVAIKINDSLLLNIQGGLPTSIKLVNLSTLKETGFEVDHDGAFAFGEFEPSLPSSPSGSSVLNIRNGLFRPAPDTQALATGNAERLRITSNGDIGIGTILPTEQLDINGGIRIRLIPPEPFPDLFTNRVLVVTPEGLILSRESDSPPNVAQQNDLLDQIADQEKTIQQLAKRISELEKKMEIE
jgi:hypothetical protein